MHKAELEALRERVRNSKGPDRQLDYDIHRRMYPDQFRNGGAATHDDWALYFHIELGREILYGPEPAYTSSLDAIVGLIERVLPGWAWLVERVDAGTTRSSAHTWLPAQRTRGLAVELVYEGAATPVLALCAALLSALIAQETTNG